LLQDEIKEFGGEAVEHDGETWRRWRRVDWW
jgi:hypothetical protein